MTWDIGVDLNTVVRSNDPNVPPVVVSKGNITNPGNAANLEGMKFDLAIDPLGRGGKVTGVLKLAQQITFAITNERVGRALTVFEFREYQAIIETAIQGLRANQVKFVSENDPEILGWDVEKLDATTNQWKKLNDRPATRIFVDESVVPTQNSYYRISRRNRSTPSQSMPVEIVQVDPPCERGTCEIRMDFQTVVIVPTRTSNTLFFAPNRHFLPGELLQDVESLNVLEGSDPRQAVVSIRALAADGTSVRRFIPRAVLQGISYG